MKRDWCAFRISTALVGAITLCALGMGVAACDTTMTEAEMLKWTHNEVGLKRITQAVADEKQPMDARIRAMEVVVERGFSLRVWSMLDAIVVDGSRDAIIKGLVDRLLGQIERGTEAQLDAKDAVMALESVMAPAQWKRAQGIISKWAFTGLAWDTPSIAVEKQIEGKISAGQIMALGAVAYEVSGILVSNGLEVDKLVRFLGKAHDSAATSALLKGLRRLHGDIGVQRFHLDALRSTGSPAAIAYLLEMYMNTNLDEEFRASAFNVAVDMMGKKGGLSGDSDRVLAQLLKLIDTQNPDDRWLGAASIISISGVDKLETVMQAFKDDKVYGNAETDTARSIMDLCLDIKDQGYSRKAGPMFTKYLSEGNRVQRVISIICIKANDGLGISELAALSRKVGKDDDIDIADLLGDEMTLGKLAQNAMDGLHQLLQLSIAVKEGKYDEEQAKTLRLLITFELEETGDTYKNLVTGRYQAWAAEQAAAEAPPTKDGK